MIICKKKHFVCCEHHIDSEKKYCDLLKFLFVYIQLEVKSSTSYPIKCLEILHHRGTKHAKSIQLYHKGREYGWSYIAKTHLDIGYKVQKSNKRNIISSSLVIDIM